MQNLINSSFQCRKMQNNRKRPAVVQVQYAQRYAAMRIAQPV